MITAVDVAQASLDTLRTRGWCKGHLVNDKGQVCAWGAVVVTSSALVRDETLRNDITRNIYSALSREMGGHAVGRWNDFRERTQREVEAAFERAIELLEAS